MGTTDRSELKRQTDETEIVTSLALWESVVLSVRFETDLLPFSPGRTLTGLIIEDIYEERNSLYMTKGLQESLSQ